MKRTTLIPRTALDAHIYYGDLHSAASTASSKLHLGTLVKHPSLAPGFTGFMAQRVQLWRSGQIKTVREQQLGFFQINYPRRGVEQNRAGGPASFWRSAFV